MDHPGPTTLWLVRHGQTEWNLEGRYQGHADIPLNSRGLAQAQDLAECLRDGGQAFSALYSSDLQRARQTAEILAGAVGLSVQVDPRLREVDQGEWEGMLFRDIKELYAAEMARRKDDPANARPPGGESLKELALRMAGAADEIAARHPGASPVLIVSHGLSLATLLARARQVSLTRAYDLIPENTNPEIIQWPAPAAQIIHQEQA